MQRQSDLEDGPPPKRARADDSGKSEIQKRIAKARSQFTGNKSTEPESEVRKDRGGLKVEAHPLLRSIVPAPVIPKRLNPVRSSNQKVRKGFTLNQFNPYIDQNDFRLEKPHRELSLNTKGKFIDAAKELRAKEHDEQLQLEEKLHNKELGLEPDESIGEHLFKLSIPPLIEWWDKMLLKDNNYSHLEEADRLLYKDVDDENCPVTEYVQHPVPVMAPWEKHLPPPKPMYLTKKEMKRIRKIERGEKHQEKQDRIRLGLDPAPAPKVKLQNLAYVLGSDAVKDPTAVEARVRNDIIERRLEHERANEERKPNPEEKSRRSEFKLEQDLANGIFSTVYKINILTNPQHRFKVDINAKQLDLKGMCIRTQQTFSLVIVEGGCKAIARFKKLMTGRIDWTQTVIPKNVEKEHLQNLSSNKCQVIWEGQLKKPHFQKWSIIENTENEEDILALLGRYRLESFWRQAKLI